MPQKEIAPGLQRVVKPLNESAPPLLGEIDQHVHAENHVHSANVYSRCQIHLCEGNHFSQSRLHLMPAVAFSEVHRQLFRADAAEASSFINTALRVLQSVPPDVGSENLHIPRIRKG